MKKLYFCDKSCTFAAEMDILALIKSSGVRNFAKLLSANVVAQVIGLVVYPILTRIYAPEDFGLLNLFLSISGVLVILSTAEYYNAIVLPKEDNDARKIIQLCLCLMLLLVVITGVSVLFSNDIASLFNTPDLAKYYWLMPILVLASGGWNIVNYWYIRCGRYDKISAYQLSQSILSSGGKIGFGYAGVLTGGMIYSVVLAPIVALCTSLFGKIKMAGVRNTFCFQDILEVAKRYKNFPLYSLPRSFVNMLAGQLPVLLLTPYFGSQYVGWWSMALLLGFIPVNMVSRSIYQVLYQKQQNDREKWNMIDSSFITTLPDTWAINKRFVMLAVNRWNDNYERVLLGGLTCDSDDYYNSEQNMNAIYLPKYNKEKPLINAVFYLLDYFTSKSHSPEPTVTEINPFL